MSELMVALSTGLMRDGTAGDAGRLLQAAGAAAIELSGGAVAADVLADLGELVTALPLWVHNYFPPPPDPFVFNLASADPSTGMRSIEHVRTALELVTALGGTTYSFHAGFLVDPVVSELGRPIAARPLADRDDALDRFVRRVNELADFANQRGIELLIENNVVSAANYERFGCDPLLMSTPAECIEVMGSTADNVNMLVDVAHLKVSALSLGFAREVMLERCAPWIRAYHLSDNDGTADTNDPVSASSWFWPHLNATVERYTVEVAGVTPAEYVAQAELVGRMLGR